MAQLVGLIVSEDEGFKKQIGRQLRGSAVPVSVVDDRARGSAVPADVIIVDARGEPSTAMNTIERMRLSAPSAAIFAVAAQVDPELILQAMRAGANEFFAWPPPDATFSDAVRRTAVRRDATGGNGRKPTTLAFLGAKGGAGTTTLAVNCGVELARLSKRPTVIVDLKAGLGEVSLFLGLRSRYSVLDAIDNLHRLDAQFLRELVVKHKSGIDVLAGSENFERPGTADAPAIEELFRLLANQYEFIVVDAGCQINTCSVASLYTADAICFVANPDVPSIRNAQRLLDRIDQLGSCRDRVRVLLNRAAEPYPIPPAQIESALGHPIHHTFPSDYKTVSSALNSGVPVSLTGNSGIAEQFDLFTRRILQVETESTPPPARTFKITGGLERIASLW